MDADEDGLEVTEAERAALRAAAAELVKVDWTGCGEPKSWTAAIVAATRAAAAYQGDLAGNLSLIVASACYWAWFLRDDMTIDEVHPYSEHGDKLHAFGLAMLVLDAQTTIYRALDYGEDGLYLPKNEPAPE